MREEEFRDRFRAALGAAPDERGAAQRAASVLRRPPRRDEPAVPSRALVLVAVALTGLVLVALLGPRLLRPASRETSRAAEAGVPAGCRLPLVVMDTRAVTNGPTPQYPLVPRYTAGFVELATGRFVADRSAQPGSMPFSRMYVNERWSPESYDPVLRRWLPVGLGQVSPDHRSYVYVVVSPLGTGKGAVYDYSTLHVYDVTTGQDRALWTTHGEIGPDPTWGPDGIHAETVPPGVEPDGYWLVDPATGAATPTAVPASVAMLEGALRSYGIDLGVAFGTDGAGRPILLDAGSRAGAPQVYFVGGPSGKRIVIHSGGSGDAVDFEPNEFTVDGDRLWAANRDATAVWLWSASGGLKRFPITGIAQFDGNVTPRVVGACV